MNELEQYNGKSFRFAEVFTCSIRNGVVFIEEYCEGEFPLRHIKTKDKLIQLYEILTGKNFFETDNYLNSI